MFENPSFYVFGVMFVLSASLNLDQGLFPAASVLIKESLHFSDAEYGLLGSIVYIGLIMGSLLSGYIYSKWQAKPVLVICLLGFVSMIGVFAVTTNKKYILVSRVIAGFF